MQLLGGRNSWIELVWLPTALVLESCVTQIIFEVDELLPRPQALTVHG